MNTGLIGVSGTVRPQVIRAAGPGWRWRLRNALRPSFVIGWLAYLLARPFARVTGLVVMTARLQARVLRSDGTVVNYGVLSYRKVTTAFVNYLVDNLIAEASAFGDFKYHDSGVGTTAENVADTAMETTDGEERVVGSQIEGGNPNEYVSVGTVTYSSTKAITEHGLFNASTSGILLDRSVFSAVNVENGDSIQFTYTLTVNAES